MAWSSLLLFAAVYLLAVASPGPGVAAVVARALGQGTRGLPAFIAGFVIGDLTWFGIAASGLAILAQSFATVFLVIKYAGCAYLLHLAWKLWTAPAAPAAVGNATRAEHSSRLFLAGLALTLGNPKAIMFFLALLPTVVHLDALTFSGMAEVAVLIAVILTTVLGCYGAAAARARRFFTSPRAMRALNRGTGTIMAGAALTIVTR